LKNSQFVSFQASSTDVVILERLASQLDRNRSDTIRYAIRKVAEELSAPITARAQHSDNRNAGGVLAA
jgi:hypothetical protein